MDEKVLRKVPAQKFGEQFELFRREAMERLEKTCEGGWFILGPEVKQFEQTYAKWLGSTYGIGVANGTDALLLALFALGIGEGDEVITTPYTYHATGAAIVRSGAKPVFVDIDPVSYNINPELIEAKITDKTKALLPVHIYGQACRMAAIQAIAEKHNLAIVEDCAQAHGTTIDGKKVGSFGEFGCFSFYPTKNLGAFGDGGMLTCDDEALNAEVRLLRHQGSVVRYEHEKAGMNSRLDELQATILNIKMKYLDKWLEQRHQKGHRYNELLKERGLDQIVTPWEEPKTYHTYHLYVIRVEARDPLMEFLKNSGIDVYIYYPTPLHLSPAFKDAGGKPGDCPEAEKAALSTFALPLYPELSDDEQVYVADKLAEFYAS